MRYRALARSGQAVSALMLRIDDDTPVELRGPLVTAALEAGVNAFDVAGSDPRTLDEVSPVLSAVDRHLLFVSVRLGIGRDRSGELVRDFSAERLTRVIEACAVRLKLGHIDLALLDDPAAPELPLRSLAALKSAREQGRTRWLGVAGSGEAMDAYLANGAFDTLVTPYSLTSGWQVRHRLNAAGAANMAVIGCESFPAELRHKPVVGGKAGGLLAWFTGRKAPEVAPRTGYGFLDRTNGWTAEEICLAYALTEPGLSSVIVAPRTLEELAALVTVPERELPSNLPAQIEMARFTAVAGAA